MRIQRCVKISKRSMKNFRRLPVMYKRTFIFLFIQIQYGYLMLVSSLLFFFMYLPSPNLGLTPPRTYNSNARGSDAYRGSNRLWIRTLDRYTRVGLPECVVSTMSGPPPETAQDRIQDKGHTPNPRIGIKIPDPAGNRTWIAALEGTATYMLVILW